MKNLFIAITLLCASFLMGCDSVSLKQEPVEPPQAFPEIVDVDTLKQLAQEKIKTLPEYQNGGTHLEEIDTIQLECQGCYKMMYEFRVQDENANVINVLDVTVNIIDFQIKSTLIELPGEKTESPVVGMANPASLFCEDHGGKLNIEKGEGGGEIGICVFEDGRECEEWAFMRGECDWGEN